MPPVWLMIPAFIGNVLFTIFGGELVTFRLITAFFAGWLLNSLLSLSDRRTNP